MTDKQLHKKRAKRKAGRKVRIAEKRLNYERMCQDWLYKRAAQQIVDEENQRLLSSPPPKHGFPTVSVNA